MAQLLFLPGGGGGGSYRLGDTTLPGGTGRTDQALFDGIDSSLGSLAGFAGASAPEALKTGLAAVAAQADSAQKVFRSQGPEAAREPIVAGLGAVRALRSRLGSLGLDEGARYDIDTRLKLKEDQFQRAAVLAQGVRIDVLADDGVVFAGQPVRVQTIVANRGVADLTVRTISLSGFDGDPSCATAAVKGGAVMPRCDLAVKIPATARVTTPYWHPLPDAARYEFDADAPVRPAVPADAIHGHDRTDDRRCGRHGPAARRVPLRGEHLQRREAHGTARRAALLGERHARDRDHSHGSHCDSGGERQRRRRWPTANSA